MTALDYETLSERIAAELTASQRVILDTFRGIANEAGILQARGEMAKALADLTKAQDEVRLAADERKAAADVYAATLQDATVSLRWERIVREANKTYWLTDEDEVGNVELDDGTVDRRPTGRKVRQQVTADEARELVDAEARRMVVVEAQRVEEADQELAAAKDRLEFAKRRLSVAQTDVQAAVAYLQILAHALPDTKAER